MKASPYDNLPASRFWRTGGPKSAAAYSESLYRPQFKIGQETRLATAGSCFAQHLHRHLGRLGYSVLDVEPAPPGLSGSAALRFGFGQFSARYGNIYGARQLRELIEEALEQSNAEAAPVWEAEGRFFDALRPAVDPEGLGSVDQVRAHRAQHLERVRQLLESFDVFVFTLGMTEAWIDLGSGRVMPSAPGTLAGRFDPTLHRFVNFGPQDPLQVRNLVE